MKFRALLCTLVAVAAGSLPAPGIIVVDPDETECLAPPADGSPWYHVARLETKTGPVATGVYLGNRYVLTTNHLDGDISVVNLNGANYSMDVVFTPIVIPGADLRVLRVATDPGLAPMPLISVSESELDKPCTMIGCGVGKGAAVHEQGWKWGDERSRQKRWATATTARKYRLDPQSKVSYIQTTFDFTAGEKTGQITAGDAGCGLFENIGGVWKLVGIGNNAETDGAALFDRDPSTPGFQPDHAYFVPIHRYVIQLKKIVGS